MRTRAAGYGIEGHTLDHGNDLAACLEVIGGAAEQARGGMDRNWWSPQFCALADTASTMTPIMCSEALKQSKTGADCLKLAEQFILNEGLADGGGNRSVAGSAVHQVEEAVATAQREPAPDPDAEDWCALSTRHLGEVMTRPH